ncbi:hypothetical protein [Pacificoceanicola onchidii]|uniref:hypothetical protein n=1 Tax=Pacificoceanicola onchidii TaxID=2562685 RepID=UPI0010A69D0D|nr:hypothetical protein [Pacificoceanicola onchidii]
MIRLIAPLALASFLPVASHAQTVLTGNHSVDGSLCVGADCVAAEGFSAAPMKVKENNTRLYFEDTSIGPSYPSNDWLLQANDSTINGAEYFAIVDDETDRQVLRLDAGAPDNALYVNSFGNVGVGTSLPQADLHIITGNVSKLRMQNTSAGADWDINIGSAGLGLLERPGTTEPFFVETGAPSDAFWIEDTGDLGFGTNKPEASVDIFRSDNSARIRVRDTGSSGAQEMFAMVNNGGSYFTLDNTDAGTTWYFVHENAAPNRFIISDAVADGPEMSLTADGVLTVPGGFVVGSTALNVPDYVFEPGYDLRPLSEVSAFIDENGHLPEVPSAAEVARDGLDMTSMQMTQLKKIEEMTLYMLEMQAVIEAQGRENAALAERLAQVEAQMAQD